MAKSNFYHTAAGPGFCLNLGLIVANSNQHASLRPGMFDRNPHQGLDELIEDDLAKHSLRSLDYRPDIQLHDRRAYRGDRRGRSSVLIKPWVRLVNLPHLAECTPAKIAVAGVSQIGVGDRLEAARGVEPRSNFMRDGFVVDEAMFPGRLNSLFVKLLGIQLAAFDPRNLSGDQCRAVPEILGTILRQHNDLLVVGGECIAIPDPLLGRCTVVLCRPGKRDIESVFSPLKMSRPGLR